MATSNGSVIGASNPNAPTAFGAVFGVTFPANLRGALSQTSYADEVYVGYKFCGNLQKFLLDYTFKVNSGIPLSDEVRQDGNTNE